jgi:hypothetical protein
MTPAHPLEPWAEQQSLRKYAKLAWYSVFFDKIKNSPVGILLRGGKAFGFLGTSLIGPLVMTCWAVEEL